MCEQPQERIFKICVIGPGKSGKTKFVRNVSGFDVDSQYIPTPGIEVHHYIFDTPTLKLVVNLCDTAGQEIYEEHYSNSDAAIVFYNVADPSSFKISDKCVDAFKRVCANSSIFKWANNCDGNDNIFLPSDFEKMPANIITYRYLFLKVIERLLNPN